MSDHERRRDPGHELATGRITVLLPAYNEAENLPVLLERIGGILEETGLSYRILVVDDGSVDGTAAIAGSAAERWPISLERHARNRGLGRALLTGLLAAVSESDVVVTMDADNTHDPALIPPMVDRLDDGFDVVIASRFAESGEERGVPPHRRVLSHGVARMMRTLFPIPGVRDYSCGYRAYRGAILERALDAYGEDDLLRESGFACMVELLLKLAGLGARFDEVPLVLRYDLKAGASKMRVVRTIGRYLALFRRNLALAGRLQARRFR